MTFPLVLGDGKRLFGEGTKPGALRMVAHEVTAGSNVIATDVPSAAEVQRQARMAAGTW